MKWRIEMNGTFGDKRLTLEGEANSEADARTRIEGFLAEIAEKAGANRTNPPIGAEWTRIDEIWIVDPSGARQRFEVS